MAAKEKESFCHRYYRWPGNVAPPPGSDVTEPAAQRLPHAMAFSRSVCCKAISDSCADHSDCRAVSVRQDNRPRHFVTARRHIQRFLLRCHAFTLGIKLFTSTFSAPRASASATSLNALWMVFHRSQLTLFPLPHSAAGAILSCRRRRTAAG